jgi:hypothetical protein
MVGPSFRFFDERVERLSGSFGDFGESLDGVIEELEFRREELGAGFEQLRATLLRRFEDIGLNQIFTDALQSRIREATPDELEALEEELSKVAVGDQTLTEALGTSYDIGSLESNLGELSPSGFRELLNQLTTIAEAEGSGGAGRDTRITSQVQRTITEFQANELLAYQQEQVMQLRKIGSYLQAQMQSAGGSMDASSIASITKSTSEVNTLNIDTINAEGMSAQEIAEKLEEAFRMAN